MPEEIPLFPLNVVLFPGMPLPLHIFEPRYREMIATCSQEERPFGVLLIKEGSDVGPPAKPYEVGTMARIVGIERLEDGRMNIMTVGTQRFRLLTLSTEKHSYLVGDIEPFDDEPAQPEPAGALIEEVASLAQRYTAFVQMASGRELVPLQLPGNPSDMSYVVGGTLQIDHLELQGLLEAGTAALRLAMEKRILERENKRIEELLRQRSSGPQGPFSRN